jgi:hypothetical protein
MAADALFSSVLRGVPCALAFPALQDPRVLSRLGEIVTLNQDLLGGARVGAVWTYPEAPAPALQLLFDDDYDVIDHSSAEPTAVINVSAEVATAATSAWVDHFLGRLRLCPYTVSTTKAAVGLDAVGVSPGAVAIRILEAGGSVSPPLSGAAAAGSSDDAQLGPGRAPAPRRNPPPPAAALAAAFWQCVAELERSPEADVATTLLVAPGYDHDFAGFCTACDEVRS